MAAASTKDKRTRSSTSTPAKAGPVVKKRKVESQDEDQTEEADDQTAALLKGFESSDEDVEPAGDGFGTGEKVPDIPKDQATQNRLKGAKAGSKGEPGVVYIGYVSIISLSNEEAGGLIGGRRIPHGFYEHEMRAYFSQFGDIRQLRLSRNKKTGRSKHYAFIEFASSEVAQIVADTMNNYLMFGHILKCRTVPKEQVHADLWKGANRRFKIVPRNKLEGKKLDAARSRDEWEHKVLEETKRRESKREQLKAMGYDFEPPALKAVEDVPRKEETKAIEA
ncbi:MAG: hypothetical protein M1832_000058 [Thelocarpon impressellum]|nr:MAG: hypothetical protein M1832_000058 [Thelocarpon impressellum]